MKTEYLREFIALSEQLNFSVTAKRLFVAQSTLSTHMAQLEEQTGLRLIDRTGTVRLTEAGSIFLDGARTALKMLDDTVERCKVVCSKNPIRIATTSTPDVTFVQLLRQRLGDSFAFVDHDYRDPFFSSFIKDEADILVSYSFEDFEPLAHEAEHLELKSVSGPWGRHSVSMMSANPLALKQNLKRADLRGARIVINSAPDFDRMKTIVNKMLGESLNLKFSLEPIGSMNDLAFVDYGDGLHICGINANAFYFTSRRDITVFDLLDGRPLVGDISLSWKKNASPDVAIAAHTMVECLKDIADSWAK